MTHCARCGRTLKHATASGLGPVCAKRVAPPAGRDLFGMDFDRAEDAAMYEVRMLIERLAAEAHIYIIKSFAEARVRLWSAAS